jgi:protein TonB
MLAYAARRSAASSSPSPNAMLAIVVGHIAVIAAVMSAKIDLPQRIFHPPIIVDTIKEDDPPPTTHETHETQPKPADSTFTQPEQHVQTPPVGDKVADNSTTKVPDFGDLIGTNPPTRVDPLPPQPAGITAGAMLATPDSELRPPYPSAKIASEEEAVLKLRLTIDEHGRVVGVDPVGRADRVFLEAARRHLMSHWRYKPAMENGRAVTSSTVITLHFQLDA